MMFLQFLMLPVWLVPLLPYVARLEGGSDWVFACGLLMGIGTFSSPLVCMFADRFLNAEKVLALCNAATAFLLLGATFTTSPGVLFFLLLATMLVYMPTWSVSSAIVLAHAPAQTFAGIRVFGSLGWVASGFFSVLGARCFGVDGFDMTHWIFLSGAAVAFVAALLALTLPATAPRARGTPVSVIDALGLRAFVLFRDPRFAVFGILFTLAMVPFQWYIAYNPLYLAEAGFRYLTLTQNLGQLGEIGFMLLVPLLVRRLGFRWTMTVGVGALVFRYACFHAAAAWGFAAGDFGGILVHGLAFGILIIGSQLYVDEVAPAELRNQAQGLVMLLSCGLGLFVSNFVFHHVIAASAVAADPACHDWTKPFDLALGMSLVLTIAMAVFFRPRTTQKECVWT